MIGPHIVSDDELLAKYGTKAIKWENGQNVVIEDQAEWYVRVNYRQAHLVNAVITDHLTGGAGMKHMFLVVLSYTKLDIAILVILMNLEF